MRIGDKNFENMETLILNHFSVVSEKIHANLQMLSAVNVCRHNAVIRAVEKNLSKEFDRLSFRNVAVGLDEGGVISGEKQVEVDRKIPWYEFFMLRQKFLISKKRQVSM